jgi:hypothetical protein
MLSIRRGGLVSRSRDLNKFLHPHIGPQIEMGATNVAEPEPSMEDSDLVSTSMTGTTEQQTSTTKTEEIYRLADEMLDDFLLKTGLTHDRQQPRIWNGHQICVIDPFIQIKVRPLLIGLLIDGEFL